MTFSCFARAAGLALTISAACVQSAAAEKWPGKSPVPGGAVAAKAIGASCPGVLGEVEMGELSAYLKRYLDTIGGRDAQLRERIGGRVLPELERAYMADYSKPGACSAGASEMAQDMLQRVRAAAGDADYWDQVLNPRVGPLDAVYAKAISGVCEGTLSEADRGMLDSFVNEQMDEFARTSSEADTATTWAHLKESEKRFSAELQQQSMCTDGVRTDARNIAAKVVAARSKAK